MNIHTPAGLDAFVDHLESGAAIILADMGAGSGQVASDWFDAMSEDVAATGARFTAVGVSRQTRQVLRVSSRGRTDCRVGRNI